MLLFPITVTTSMGVWQITRLQWKIDLLDERDAKLSAAPFDLDEAPPVEDEIDAAEFEYCKVKVEGSLDGSKVLFLGPRSPQAHVPSAMKLGKTVTGYNVIQAMTLPSGRRILLNRGWVMAEDRKLKDVADLPEEGGFLGIVKGPEEPRTFINFVKDPQSSSAGSDKGSSTTAVATADYLWRDVVGMAAQLNTEPICVDAIEDMDEAGSGGGSLGSNRLSNHVNSTRDAYVPFKADLNHYLHVRTPPTQHMAYAATWFTLSGIFTFMAFRARRKAAARVLRGR